MEKFPSKFSVEELISRWDEYTSLSRFAGNDDCMDLIFVSKRSKQSVRLIRKANSAYEPFATVFRGKIRKKGSESEIIGVFTKTIFDYITILFAMSMLFIMRDFVMDRGDDPSTINALIIMGFIITVILIIGRKKTKKLFRDFISRIADNEKF